jgi:ABC-type dipeptide/oligopeptide/nickel transport system permease subunit
LGRRRTAEKQEGWAGMGRIFKAVLALAVLGFIGLGAYAYLGDMTPPQTQVTQPVMLNAD